MRDEHRTDHVKLGRSGTRSGLVSAVVLFGAAKGVPHSTLEAATGVPIAALVDPEARVPDQALGKAWRAIGQALPNAVPALEMASAAPLQSVVGPFAQAARFAATQREALETLVRYHKVLSGGLTVALVDGDGELALTLLHTQDAHDDGHGAELALAIGARVGREVLGVRDADVRRVSFAHGPRAPAERYEAWFGCPVVFGAERNAVVFAADVLDARAPLADPTLYAYVDSHLRLQVQALLAQTEEAPLDRVRMRIAELAERGEYGAEALARSLGMSLRTLQRFTRKHGASVRDLIEATRQANATELLADERLSVEQVAFLLGYGDDRAFRRAFRRWTGHTPAAWRRAR